MTDNYRSYQIVLDVLVKDFPTDEEWDPFALDWNAAMHSGLTDEREKRCVRLFSVTIADNSDLTLHSEKKDKWKGNMRSDE